VDVQGKPNRDSQQSLFRVRLALVHIPFFSQKGAPHRKFFRRKLFINSKARVTKSARPVRWKFREVETGKYQNNALKEGEHGSILT
jgi:hypothetical protein